MCWHVIAHLRGFLRQWRAYSFPDALRMQRNCHYFHTDAAGGEHGERA